MVVTALRIGFSRARRHIGLTLFLLLLNLLFAALLTVPFYRGLMSSIGHSLAGAPLLEGFRTAWLAEFRFAHGDLFRAMDALLLPAGILYFLLGSILSGGILEVCIRGESGGWSRTFFRGVAAHALPFLRLGIAAAVLLLLSHWLLMTELREVIEAWIEESPRPTLAFAVDTGLPILTILVVLFLDMIFDYARIQKIRCGLPSALLSTVGAIRFCRARLRGTVALCAAMLLFTGVLHGLYLLVYSFIPQDDLPGILLLFVVQEVWMAGRLFLRVAGFAAQAEYHRRGMIAGGAPPRSGLLP